MTAPLAHTAAELVGIALHQLRVQPHHPEQAGHSLPGCGVSGLDAVRLDGFDDLPTHAVHRVQNVHGGLEDHGDAPPPQEPHLLLGQGQNVLPVQEHPAGRQPGVVG